MSLYILDNALWFPPADEATEEGLLAIGGDLAEERLLLAYRNGIFPWFEDDYPLWWCPDPRFVLIPPELKISKSMQQVLRKKQFEFKIDNDFGKVIQHCKTVKREDQEGTWITEPMIEAYNNLHKKGYAHSAETWLDNKLVGGLYGVRMGKVFFGESMFSLVPNASKFAFINYVQLLEKDGVRLIDCQVYTQHLETLGAKMIPRKHFLHMLKTYVNN